MRWVGFGNETSGCIAALMRLLQRRQGDDPEDPHAAAEAEARRVLSTSPPDRAVSLPVLAQRQLQELARVPGLTVTFKARRSSGQTDFGGTLDRSTRGETELAAHHRDESAGLEWTKIPNRVDDVGEAFSGVPRGARFGLDIHVCLYNCKNLGQISQALHHELAAHAMALGRLVRDFKKSTEDLKAFLVRHMVEPAVEHRDLRNGDNPFYMELRRQFLDECGRQPPLARVRSDYLAGEQQDGLNFP